MFLATSKHILLLQLLAFSFCFLTLVRSAEAAEGVVVERNAFPGADFEWSVAHSGDGESTNEHDWAKRGKSGTCAACVKEGNLGDDEAIQDDVPLDSGGDIIWEKVKRMERANANSGHFPGETQEGSEWNKREIDWTAPPADENNSHEWGKRVDIDWQASPVDNNDGNDWGKRDEASSNGVCASCIKKRIANLVWPPALSKRGPIEPSKNQPCKYVIGADGPTDNVPGGCQPQKRDDNYIGPGPGSDTKDGPDDSHDWLLKRSSSGVLPFLRPGPFAPSFGPTLKMNKRGLIEEWMHPHSMEKRQSCQDPGWQRCDNNNGCCQSSANCCATGCKKDPTDICCPGYSCPAGAQCDRLCGGCVISGGGCCPDGRRTCASGQQCCPDGCVASGSKCCQGGGSCPPGRKCCEDGCALEGEECCRGGGACGVGNICVLFNGVKGCCTDLKCTAVASGGAVVPLTPTQEVEVPTEAPTPPPTTAAPKPPTNTQVDVVYYTYYYTITWWYYFYYYTYFAQLDVSTVTSSATTIYTTVTLTNTAPEAASSEFKAISSSIVEEFTTPAEATTALATPTLPGKTASEAPTESEQPSITSASSEVKPEETPQETTAEETTVTETPQGETPVPLPTPSRTTQPPTVPTGGSAAMVEVNRWLSWSMGAVALVAGVGMVWL